MDFQVHEQTYFLSLAEDERQWEVFVDTPDGPRAVPVYVGRAEVGTHRRVTRREASDTELNQRGGRKWQTRFSRLSAGPEAVASGPQFVHPADFRTRGEAELFAQSLQGGTSGIRL